MPNIAEALKSEISRLARKEIRGEISVLKKAATQQRSHIAALRKKIDELERALKKTARASQKRSVPDAGEEASEVSLRFRAAGLASHRQRLGLSAADFGKLVGVSGQTIYKWESGEVKPRRTQLQAIAGVRTIGRREAQRRLASGA